MRLGPVFLQAFTCKQICGWNSIWKLYISESFWGRSHFEICIDKMLRHSVSSKAAARKRSGLCTCFDICLHTKPAAGFRFRWEGGAGAGWRAAHYQCGATHQNPVLRRKKPYSTSTLGNFEVSVCLPKLVVAFFYCLLAFGERDSLIGCKYWISNKFSLAISEPERNYFIESPHMSEESPPITDMGEMSVFPAKFQFS